ncbi:MAG: hypothetical protein NVS9B1_01490 [Candidatus Dormibacteraceae bacterium]
MGDVVSDLPAAVLVDDGDRPWLGPDQGRGLVGADDRGQDQDVVSGADLAVRPSITVKLRQVQLSPSPAAGR